MYNIKLAWKITRILCIEYPEYQLSAVGYTNEKIFQNFLVESI